MDSLTRLWLPRCLYSGAPRRQGKRRRAGNLRWNPRGGVGTKRMQCGAGGRRDCSARRDPGADRRGCKKKRGPAPPCNLLSYCTVTAQFLFGLVRGG